MASPRKLGRNSAQRKAMLRSLVTSLFEHGAITTTDARAKEVRSIAEKMITLAVKEHNNSVEATKTVSRAKLDKDGKKVLVSKTSKNGRNYSVVEREVVTETVKQDLPSKLAARRQIMSYVYKIKDSDGKNIDIPTKLFDEIAPKYENKNGGYTRTLKLGPRKGDNTELVRIELV